MSDFKIGQFVRVKATGRAMQIAGASSPELPLAVFLKRGSLRELRTVEGIEPWTPRPGESVRYLYRDGDRWGDGKYLERCAESHRVHVGFIIFTVPLDTRFEPVFVEPEKLTVGTATFNGVEFPTERAVITRALNGDEGGTRAPVDIRIGSPDASQHFIAPEPPTPLTELRKRRLESAKAVLGGEWKGKGK